VKNSDSKSTGRPPAFTYRKVEKQSALHCDSVPLTKLADKYGTPLYVYSASTIRERYQAFDHAFRRVPHTICYSVKANSNLSLLKMLAKMGSGFDVVSGGELERILRADRKAARRVVFSGVGKTAEEMDAALKAGILMFNLESESELAVLASRAAKLRNTARIAFRVNPDVQAETHPYISTGLREHKFGVPIDRARELYALAAQHDHIEPIGVSVHIGSQITNVAPFADAMQRVAALVRDLISDGLNIGYIDAGGGLGISYHGPAKTAFAKGVDEYAQSLATPLRDLDIHLLLEPGRAIVAPAGALLTRVLYRKTNGNKQFVVVDAAMNDLIRPSLYQAHHDIVPVVVNSGADSDKVDIVGPICETGDFFARDRQLPNIPEGDLLAILDTGAYGMSLASNYNTRTRPAEVLVDGRSTKLIRRREELADLLRTEL
jgi:diaminopimelate decarboxylase